eukprot:541551-Rhodomonas_salina.1
MSGGSALTVFFAELLKRNSTKSGRKSSVSGSGILQRMKMSGKQAAEARAAEVRAAGMSEIAGTGQGKGTGQGTGQGRGGRGANESALGRDRLAVAISMTTRTKLAAEEVRKQTCEIQCAKGAAKPGSKTWMLKKVREECDPNPQTRKKWKRK